MFVISSCILFCIFEICHDEIKGILIFVVYTVKNTASLIYMEIFITLATNIVEETIYSTCQDKKESHHLDLFTGLQTIHSH